MKKTRIFHNGIRHSHDTKQKAIEMRKSGKTHGEIAKELGISRGTAHLWTRGIAILTEQRAAILERARIHAFTHERRKKLSISAKMHLAPKEKYTSEILLGKIRQFYKEHQRIPLKREFNMYREYKKHFGSWNQAIQRAGFATNPELFARKFVAKDGHFCDSFTEKIIDDWLFENNIAHKRRFIYLKTKLTADFFLEPNVIIEFFGLAGVQRKYDENIRRKRKICKEHNFFLIEIYPKDIFPNNKLPEIFPRP